MNMSEEYQHQQCSTWLLEPRAGLWERTPSLLAGEGSGEASPRPSPEETFLPPKSCRCRHYRLRPHERHRPCRDPFRWRRPCCPVWSAPAGDTVGMSDWRRQNIMLCIHLCKIKDTGTRTKGMFFLLPTITLVWLMFSVSLASRHLNVAKKKKKRPSDINLHLKFCQWIKFKSLSVIIKVGWI